MTRRQAEVYYFLEEYFRQYHTFPSVVDICEQFGFKSLNAASDHLKAIERAGLIERYSFDYKKGAAFRFTQKKVLLVDLI